MDAGGPGGRKGDRSDCGEEPGGFEIFIFGRDSPRQAEIVRDRSRQVELMGGCNSCCLWLCRAGLVLGPGGEIFAAKERKRAQKWERGCTRCGVRAQDDGTTGRLADWAGGLLAGPAASRKVSLIVRTDTFWFVASMPSPAVRE